MSDKPPRYTVVQIGQEPNDWYVYDAERNDYVAQEIPLGLAHVFAWAANQIAQRRVIVALVPSDADPNGPRYAGYYCEDYTGPTEGVAP